jgi:N-acetylneuraminate synthase
MIISTGMANANEIAEAIETARMGGCNELAILHCVSGYPAPASDYNLLIIPNMIDRFGLVTGLSDHTLDNTTALVSVGLGASIIEKHFTLNREGGGPDDSFSLEPAEMLALCNGVRVAWEAKGSVDYGYKSSEAGNVKYRRSLYFVKDMEKGESITPESIRSVRPGFGLAPKYYEELMGRKVSQEVKKHTAVSFEVLEKDEK